jgi:hypothetical protein
MGKIFGASYAISVLIVSPNRVHNDGTKILEDDTADEAKIENILALENVCFRYPSKPDVKTL